MNPKEIALVAAKAGFQGADLQTAVAVAMAESGGNPTAHALTSREDSRGLWQINVRAHTEFASQNLFDPQTNAFAARAVLKKQGWGAWSVFKNGKFLLYMPTAGAAVLSLPAGVKISSNPLSDPVGAVAGSPVGQGISDTLKGFSGALGALEKLRAWVTTPANLGRLATGVVGAVVIVVGIAVLARPVLEPVAKAAGKAADIAL